MKEQKEGRRRERAGRREKGREESYGEGKGRGEKHFSSSLFFFFFLIGRKIPAKNFTSLLTNSLREETHTI